MISKINNILYTTDLSENSAHGTVKGLGLNSKDAQNMRLVAPAPRGLFNSRIPRLRDRIAISAPDTPICDQHEITSAGPIETNHVRDNLVITVHDKEPVVFLDMFFAPW